MKLNEWIKNILKHKKVAIIGILVVVGLVISAIVFTVIHNDKQKIDTDYLLATIQESSELTTAKLSYTGLSEFTDSGIAFINRADFKMIYHATARIGIDVKKIRVESDDSQKIIYVDIPKAEVQDVKVDASTIKYYDEKFALFNVNEKEDGNQAIALAEQEAKAEIGKMGCLKMADDQSATLVKGVLANAIPDGYQISVRQAAQ